MKETIKLNNEISILKSIVKDQDKEIKILRKALELACLVISKAMCPNGDWETLKIDFANSYIEQVKEMMKSE